ncbi:N-6 DNA methylase [Croceibacterium soli]|nr:N-6 DNA methylase [Croceibacterium soli]
MVAELVRRFRDRGTRGSEATLLAAATLAAWNEDRAASDARSLFQRLAERFSPECMGGGVEAAENWLSDPALSVKDWAMLDAALDYLHCKEASPINWTTEVGACLDAHVQHGTMSLSLPLAEAVSRTIDLPIGGTFACLYSGSATVAWVLAKERDVVLHADREVAIILALLARAACRPLRISRRNPLAGTFMPGPFVYDSPTHQPPFDHFDHIFSVPPFGRRIEEGPAKGAPHEAFHLERLAERATRSFTSVVPDGVLFRETKFETELRRKLVENRRVTVMSLPPGMYWPASGVSASLLMLEPGGQAIRMIDGRSMKKTSSGRVQEGLIVQHLEQFRGLRVEEPRRETFVGPEEIARNSFSLLPDRYLRSGTLAEVEKSLAERQTVTLGEIADVERSKAPLPLRDATEDPPLTAMEIAPMDLVDGRVRIPSRQQAFELREESRVRGVTVRPGDILVSIKGNVGNVGIVDTYASVAEQLNDPWIISQSLAIVRLKQNRHVSSPTILNALLTAPWVREKLESMAGGSTVKSLPMSALRSLVIPVPTLEECAGAEAELSRLVAAREQIEKQQEALAERQRHLWAELWQMPADFGEE